MFVENLYPVTSSRLAVVASDATLQSAAALLSRSDIGLLVVCSHRGCAEGVLSKSDLVRLFAGSASADSPVSHAMSREIVTCRPQDEIHAAWQVMTARDLQNLPVVDAENGPIGILNIRDAMNALFAQEEMQERMLANYVNGCGYR